jgi:hypothetical protein
LAKSAAERCEGAMSLSHASLRFLISQLERDHGPEQGVWSTERFVFRVWFDDGAQYRLCWPRGSHNPAWEVIREQ